MKTVLSFILALILPVMAFAADGNVLSTYERTEANAFLICDSVTTARACGQIDTKDIDYRTVIFSIYTNTGCSSVTANVQHRAGSASVLSVLGTLNLTTTTIVQNTKVSRYVRVDVTTSTGCTDLDVVVEFIQ